MSNVPFDERPSSVAVVDDCTTANAQGALVVVRSGTSTVDDALDEVI